MNYIPTNHMNLIRTVSCCNIDGDLYEEIDENDDIIGYKILGYNILDCSDIEISAETEDEVIAKFSSYVFDIIYNSNVVGEKAENTVSMITNLMRQAGILAIYDKGDHIGVIPVFSNGTISVIPGEEFTYKEFMKDVDIINKLMFRKKEEEYPKDKEKEHMKFTAVNKAFADVNEAFDILKERINVSFDIIKKDFIEASAFNIEPIDFGEDEDDTSDK